MRPHPRIQKTLKWVGAAATVLLAVVWVGSIWCTAAYMTSFGAIVGVGHGEVFAASLKTPSDWGLLWHPASAHDDVYRTVFGHVTFSLRPVRIVGLWAVGAAIVLLWVAERFLAARARRHAALNLCPKCDYDRTGLAAGAVCPECGATSPAQ